MSLFYPYYDSNGRPSGYPDSTPLVQIFRDLNRIARILDKPVTHDSISKKLRDIENTPFDNIVSSDENSMSYTINVPDNITQDDVVIDVTNGNRTLTVEVSKEHENGSTESYRHTRTTPREIDVDTLQAHLDTETHQVVLEIPFVVEEKQLESPEETFIPLQISSPQKDEHPQNKETQKKQTKKKPTKKSPASDNK